MSAPAGQPTARTKARKRALDVLFAAEQRGLPALDLLADTLAEASGAKNDYTEAIVRGVDAERARIDEVLSTYSTGWSLDRMPAVDRNVLRIGIWEILFSADVPTHVAISEAMHLVRDLSTDESPVFVNGVLGAIERDRADLI